MGYFFKVIAYLFSEIYLKQIYLASLIYPVLENDTATIQLLIDGDEIAFENIFKTYFKSLHSYALSILRDEDIAEEIVQNLFLKLWEKKERLEVQSSLKSYLYRSVYNESMNWIKHQQVKVRYQRHQLYVVENESEQAAERLHFRELEQRLHQAMNQLPEKCRTVFQLSRFESLKYQEIATQLEISIKTVENQMGKALKILRTELIDFLPLIFLMLFNRF